MVCTYDSCICTVNGKLLHIIAHVSCLDHGLARLHDLKLEIEIRSRIFFSGRWSKGSELYQLMCQYLAEITTLSSNTGLNSKS